MYGYTRTRIPSGFVIKPHVMAPLLPGTSQKWIHTSIDVTHFARCLDGGGHGVRHLHCACLHMSPILCLLACIVLAPTDFHPPLPAPIVLA